MSNILRKVDPNNILSQELRLLKALKLCPVSTLDARNILSIMHPASRIQSLRDKEYIITTHPLKPLGKSSRKPIALYVLKGKKNG